MTRPSEISSSVAALMASNPGERLKTLAMPVASPSVLVASAISASSWNCSYAHASGTQMES